MSKVERHSQTQAAKTTTVAATPRPGPTPQQIQAEQAAATKPSAAAQRGTPATKMPAATPTSAPVNAAALERHLAELAGPAGRLLAPNGQTGIHRTLDDGVEMVMPRKFDAYLEQLRRGFIKFVPDEAPLLVMTGIAEDVPFPRREELGDLDQSQWPISDFTGQPDDPWKPQVTFPIVSADDDAAEVFIYVARGVVAENAVTGLLGKWQFHPNRRKGLVPLIEIGNGTFWSKRFQCDRPKPVLKIVGWSDKGAGPTIPKPAAVDFKDSIPF